MKQTNPFYVTKKWKKKRANILRRDNYECRECKRYGKVTQATTVHHIYPLDSFPLLKLVNENLISLCNKCHEAMHDRFTNEITVTGERWQKKISPHLQKF
ncbi:HNH endonuclease [Virgibacillus salexigens]|uniref:HNH endonuclease n=1 Tax=Virgibacillus salexigens TaxID=61016 RepID=UPI0030812211